MLIDWILQMDRAILLFLQEHVRVDAMNGFWRVVTSLGNVGWFWILTAVLLLLYKQTRKVGFTALCSLALEVLIANVILKNLVGRIRPYEVITELVPLIPLPIDTSFPSGHTGASFAVALICFKMLPRRYGVPAVVLAALIAFSRLYLGVHYLTDVLGGFFVAYVASTVVYWALQKRQADAMGNNGVTREE